MSFIFGLLDDTQEALAQWGKLHARRLFVELRQK
jgi:hypothetical protein